ncbi:MAG TPA: 2,3-bisphosphoglycerate-independent phosphoglycerate mutase [Candidatus Acidoferrum sp.]|nr:2,3-bisphosphoglycerate-independent phosphoglycerate mutase [Candidatus Acidoferrum sp.]
MKPFVLVVLDGWGVSDKREGNAIAQAKTPNLDHIAAQWPHTTIAASGPAVGLPEGQVGNSEVGHQNIGAGRKVPQDYVRINQAIEGGEFFRNQVLLDACAHVKKNNSQLHICGLLGNGGVHSHQKHLEALLKLVQQQGVERVFLHCFTDGRDTSPSASLQFMQQLQTYIAALGGEYPAHIATVIGRYYAMDRDNHWTRTGKAFEAMVFGRGAQAASPIDAIQRSYNKNITDEFIEPTVITHHNQPVATIQDGDAVIDFDFRPDRERQLTDDFVLDTLPPGDDLHGFQRPKNLYFVTMTTYQTGLDAKVAFADETVTMPLGQVIAERGLKQFHTAETEKYAHVTYFINGRREEPFAGEDRAMVPSPKVTTYDLQPAMSAAGVTDKAIAALQSGRYALIIMNYANGDMVGHTGVLEATIKAVEAVDTEIGRVAGAVRAAGGNLLITADHGKAEQMLDAEGKTLTGHTLNPVPVYLIAPDFAQVSLRAGGILADIAPTVLQVMGIPRPDVMSGRSLIE